jgi:hypothetical protein
MTALKPVHSSGWQQTYLIMQLGKTRRGKWVPSRRFTPFSSDIKSSYMIIVDFAHRKRNCSLQNNSA